jgi:hypothetical protein
VNALLAIAVVAQLGASQPAIVSRAPVTPGSSVAFHALVVPDTVYLGEQATYQIAVFLDDQVRARMRRNPEFVPPELRSLVTYDLPAAAGRVYQRVIGGRTYEVHVFERAMFGLAPGVINIPPAQLLYSLPLSASFFSREESHAISSESSRLLVRQPPQEGRPDDFAGAIGNLALRAHLDSRAGRMGDPFILTVTVSGEANVAHLPRPEVKVPWGSVVSATERVQLDSAAVRVRGRKEFDFILTPRDTGTLAVPEIRYWFFNPSSERYELAVAQPESLVVRHGTLASSDTVSVSDGPLPLREVFGGEVPPPVPERPWFWALVLLAPAPALTRSLLNAIRRRERAGPTGQRVLFRLAKSDSADVSGIRRAYVRALADRLSLPAESLTRRGELARALRLEGVTPEAARQADDLLVELDAAIYSADSRTVPRFAGKRALDLVRRVDREAIRRVVHTVALVAAMVAAAPAMAGPADDVAIREDFARGVAQYARKEYSLATGTFAAIAESETRAPDAWANMGTSAWAAGDTATASLGWQRALRLEPRAGDVRERLRLLSVSEPGLISMVPPVSSSEVAVIALVVWIALWSLLATRRRVMHAPLWVTLTLTGAVFVSGAAAGGIAELEAGRRLAVIREAGGLRKSPALGADRGAGLLAGEVARTLSRQGVWTRIELDGGRVGWIESQRLLPLGR